MNKLATGTGTYRILTAVDSDRAERIARIKAQVSAGTYRIDFDRLAERLVDDELTLR